MREIHFFKVDDDKDWEYGVNFIKDNKVHARHYFTSLKSAQEYIKFAEENNKKYGFEYKINTVLEIE